MAWWIFLIFSLISASHILATSENSETSEKEVELIPGEEQIHRTPIIWNKPVFRNNVSAMEPLGNYLFAYIPPLKTPQNHTESVYYLDKVKNKTTITVGIHKHDFSLINNLVESAAALLNGNDEDTKTLKQVDHPTVIRWVNVVKTATQPDHAVVVWRSNRTVVSSRVKQPELSFTKNLDDDLALVDLPGDADIGARWNKIYSKAKSIYLNI